MLVILAHYFWRCACLHDASSARERSVASRDRRPRQRGLSGALCRARPSPTPLFGRLSWAPKISGPITDLMTSGDAHRREKSRPAVDPVVQQRGCRRVTLFLCFLEGVRQPWMPTAFIIGLQNSKPGSWFEKVYAREVFRFNNTSKLCPGLRSVEKTWDQTGTLTPIQKSI